MKLEHPFIRRCVDRHALLDGCLKLNTFLGRLEKQAKQYGGDDEDRVNEYNRYGVQIEDNDNTDQNMFRGKVRVLTREKLRVLVDKHKNFWDSFRQSWEESL